MYSAASLQLANRGVVAGLLCAAVLVALAGALKMEESSRFGFVAVAAAMIISVCASHPGFFDSTVYASSFIVLAAHASICGFFLFLVCAVEAETRVRALTSH